MFGRIIHLEKSVQFMPSKSLGWHFIQTVLIMFTPGKGGMFLPSLEYNMMPAFFGQDISVL